MEAHVLKNLGPIVYVADLAIQHCAAMAPTAGSGATYQVVNNQQSSLPSGWNSCLEQSARRYYNLLTFRRKLKTNLLRLRFSHHNYYLCA